jgi:ankyrin repeat protein
MTTPLFEAIKQGDAGRVRDLLASDRALLSARNQQGASAISVAVYHGKPEIARIFTGLGAPLDLFEACALGDLARVQTLVEADPAASSSFSPDGYPALALAAFFGHGGVVRLLLSRGANVNASARNAMKVAAIHAAAARRDPSIVAMLLDAGADPNAAQQRGFRPIHASAQSGDEETARLLVHRGADAGTRTEDGKTPADLAREHGHDRLAGWLETSQN